MKTCTCVLVYLCICPQTQWLPDWSEIWAEAQSSRFRVLFAKLKNWVFTPVFSSKRHIVSIFYPFNMLIAQSLCR